MSRGQQRPRPYGRTRAAVLIATIAVIAAVTMPQHSSVAVGPDTAEKADVGGLQRPFALPGFQEGTFNGALYVGDGESRFALRVNLRTQDNQVIREDMVPYIGKIGPGTMDGSYYELQVTTDDREITPERLDALREVLAQPDEWPANMVAEAEELLPVLEQRYEQTRRDKRTILLRFARTAPGTLVGSVTALHDDTTVFLEAAPAWEEDAPGTYEVSDHRVVASAPGTTDPSQVGHFALEPTQRPDQAASYASVSDMVSAMTGESGAPGNAAAALRYSLHKGQRITFTSSVSGEPIATGEANQSEILAALQQAKAHADDGTLSGTGPLGRAATAMRDAIALNSNYDKDFLQSFVMWGHSGGGAQWIRDPGRTTPGTAIFPGWDSAWEAIIATTVDPGLAQEHERNLFDAAGGPWYRQLSSGPMHAYAVWRIYAATGDRALAQETYPTLVDFFDQLREWDVDRDGLLEAPYEGDDVTSRGNHLGIDDGAVWAEYQRIPKSGPTEDPRLRDHSDLTDVALNSYYALMAQSLAKTADVLDRPADAQRFTAVFEQVKQRMNDRLWNEEQGLYLNRYLDGRWRQVVTPTVFYPMFGAVATQDRAERLVREHLLDPGEFWGEYVVPSVSRSDPAYCANGEIHESSARYRFFQGWDEVSACEEWQGAVWPPMNATVYDGLKRYGFDAAAGQLAAKGTAMWLDTWDKESWFAEYFDSEPGQVINASAVDTAWRTYSWSTLMPLMAVRELVAEDPWSEPGSVTFGSLTLPGLNTVDDVRLHGHVYGASVGPEVTELTRDGRTVFRAVGARVVVRDFVPFQDGACFDVNAAAPARLQVLLDSGQPRQTTVPAGHTRDVCLSSERRSPR